MYKLKITKQRGKNEKSNAIYNSKTQFIDHLKKNKINSRLFTHGNHVGLPKRQFGNSEVGHLNIGAGRIVDQDLLRINNSIKEKTIFNNNILTKYFKYLMQVYTSCKHRNKKKKP